MFVTYSSICQTKDVLLGFVHPATLYSWLFFLYFGIGSMPELNGLNTQTFMYASYFGYSLAGLIALFFIHCSGFTVVVKECNTLI